MFGVTNAGRAGGWPAANSVAMADEIATCGLGTDALPPTRTGPDRLRIPFRVHLARDSGYATARDVDGLAALLASDLPGRLEGLRVERRIGFRQ